MAHNYVNHSPNFQYVPYIFSSPQFLLIYSTFETAKQRIDHSLLPAILSHMVLSNRLLALSLLRALANFSSSQQPPTSTLVVPFAIFGTLNVFYRAFGRTTYFSFNGMRPMCRLASEEIFSFSRNRQLSSTIRRNPIKID